MAKLAADHSPGAYAVDVQCLTCGKMLRLADSVMDIDGPAFKAYYHTNCAIKTLGVERAAIASAHSAAQERRLRGQ